ncbi:Spliceosome-associated protein 49 [Saxophila tyrrhenica]|uniref:Spliceosome-associated protein 49 n=1 Tax=Saxophila tyrrhenica TaxID=1690608 RepID=A0AAV9P1D6_9PEZI|nr:Spliceosome-associated protein 49 [Saxophila tyrrhenica]
MSGGGNRHYDQDKDSTIYVGQIEERIPDRLIWELFTQAGPVVNVHLPKDRVSQSHQGFGFVEFRGEKDADYACQLMNNISLNNKRLRVNKASADRRGPGGEPAAAAQGIGAELFIGNLDSTADERALFDVFSRFGSLIATPKIARTEDGLPKGFGFLSYSTFEASDDAIEHMNGQPFGPSSQEITVQYAYKKDGKSERHGDPAERALAAQAKAHGIEVHSMAGVPPTGPANPYGAPFKPEDPAPPPQPAAFTPQHTPQPGPYAQQYPPQYSNQGYNPNQGYSNQGYNAPQPQYPQQYQPQQYQPHQYQPYQFPTPQPTYNTMAPPPMGAFPPPNANLPPRPPGPYPNNYPNQHNGASQLP